MRMSSAFMVTQIFFSIQRIFQHYIYSPLTSIQLLQGCSKHKIPYTMRQSVMSGTLLIHTFFRLGIVQGDLNDVLLMRI